MAGERFLHPECGHSDKVNLLTDLEYRVWTVYILTADDFGVMRMSAITVQAACDALSVKPSKVIQRCLQRLVDVGLLMDFEHQKRQYLCQWDWATWQPMRFVRESMQPVPPPAVLARCDASTVDRFIDRHPLYHKSVDESYTATTSPSGREVASAPDGEVPSEAHHALANSKQLTANSFLRERFAEFWTHYPRKVGKDAAWKSWLKLKPSPDLLQLMLSVLAWQKQQDSWVKDGGQYIPHPATWLNQGRWQDEPTEAASANASSLALVRAGREFLRHD